MATKADHSNGVLEGLLGEIADDYTRRLEAGESPAIEEYAERHPALAATIREVFPALEAMHARPGGEMLDWPSAESSRGYQPEYLGDYRIVRELGRGGMGVVYEAEQQSLRRQVALKVLPFAAVLDARQLQRFKNEAQAAANLHHAHIVPVFALGCERGVYYYAMQYIDGQPLSTVIQQLQEQSGAAVGRAANSTPADPSGTEHSSEAARLPSHPIGTAGSSHLTCSLTDLSSGAATEHGARRQLHRTIAEIGIQAAEGLQYAHEHGVVHRDIKPSNLLLTSNGHLWITDFGLAMMHSEPNLTSPGDLLGTVRYMSPEQAFAKRVPIDHRTDIYSLGVTLYELLALRPAFDGGGREELLRQIAFEDPRPLRRVDPSIPRELETIVGKAMAKRPDDRYANAAELAEDLRRFLDDKPIMAKPPTALDRASKWSRRHRSVVVSTAAFLVLAVVGLAASTILVIDQRNLARSQQWQAEANLRIARGNMDRMLRWLETKTQDVSQLPHLDRTRQEALEESLAFHRSLLPEKLNDPQARHDAGQVHIVVGRIRAMMGQQQASEKAYADGLSILEELAEEFPQSQDHAESLARGYLQLAVTRWQAKSFEPAAESVGRALKLLETLASGEQAEIGLRQERCRALNLAGLIARDRQEYAQAQMIFERATVLQAEIARFCPQDPQHRVELAQMYRNLADVQVKMQRLREAAQTVELAISLQLDLAKSYPNEPGYNQELCSTRQWWSEMESISQGVELLAPPAPTVLATGTEPAAGQQASPAVLADAWGLINASLRRAGTSDSAREAYRQSVAAQEKLVAADPDNRQYRDRLCNVHCQQARSMLFSWRLDEALEAYTQAMEVSATLLLDEPTDRKCQARMQEILDGIKSARIRRPIAQLVSPSKRSPEGVAGAVERARHLDRKELGNDPISLLLYGEFLILADEPDRAVPVIREAIDLGGATPAFRKSLGLALLRSHRADEAKAAFEAALKDWREPQSRQAAANPDEWTAAYLSGRVTADEFAKRWADRAMCSGHLGCLPWFYIGMRLEAEGKPAEARAAYAKAVEAGQKTNPHMVANFAAYRLRQMDEAGAANSGLAK